MPHPARTVLQRLDAARIAARHRLREEKRRELRLALSELLPHTPVFVFGSLTRPGKFNARSDIDLALQHEPSQMSEYGLSALLEERLGHPIDIVILDRCRFAAKIRQEGELWTI